MLPRRYCCFVRVLVPSTVRSYRDWTSLQVPSERLEKPGIYQDIGLLWLVDLIFNVLVNNFTVMLGWSHHFLGITSTFGVNVPCSRTQHSLTQGWQNPGIYEYFPSRRELLVNPGIYLGNTGYSGKFNFHDNKKVFFSKLGLILCYTYFSINYGY